MDWVETTAIDVNRNLLADYAILRDRGDLLKLQEYVATVSSTFLHRFFEKGEYCRDAISVLCKAATDEDGAIRDIGCAAIFSSITERLSDAFNQRCVGLYDSMFAQIIDFCRHLPSGQRLHFLLSRFGINTEQEILRRKAKRASPFLASSKDKIKKVFVLSRVTVGAEVAVTSVILQKMKQTFPDARTVLLAPPSMSGLFSGDTAIHFVGVTYQRHSGVLERLHSWVSLIQSLDVQMTGLQSGEFIIVDPDSRLTQLGLLPLSEDDAAHYFYESRSFKKPGVACISELTAEWLDQIFGAGAAQARPYVDFCVRDSAYGAEMCRRLRRGGARRIVTLNFGIGGNPEKRMGGSFEADLLCELLADGNTLVLDKGVGKEREEVDKLTAMLRARGHSVVEWAEDAALTIDDGRKISCDVVAWEGSVAKFGSIIAHSQLYIGYDSAFQHIAAALRVPLIDVFADVHGPLFGERWHPYGKGIIRVVRIQPAQLESRKIMEAVMACYREIKDSSCGPARE